MIKFLSMIRGLDCWQRVELKIFKGSRNIEAVALALLYRKLKLRKMIMAGRMGRNRMN